MPSEVLTKVFDPYFTTKEMGEGTGLGLFVAHGIVEEHGGEIAAESEPGVGSTFTVYLPLTDEEAGSKEVPLDTLAAGKERVLFVDDEELLVNTGRQTLERLGYAVVTGCSGVEALNLFKAHPGQYDVVIVYGRLRIPRSTRGAHAFHISRNLCPGRRATPRHVNRRRASRAVARLCH